MKHKLEAIAAVLTILVCFASCIAHEAETSQIEYTEPIPTATPTPTSTPTPTPTPKPNRATVYNKYILRGCYIDDLQVTYTRMNLTSLGRHFITGYCACSKCCGWNTGICADGTHVFRANEENRLTEYTTCAIDRKYYSFGQLFYIPSEDRIYEAHDTGAFRGKWLDLYQNSHSDVNVFNTRYEEVYAVDFEQVTFRAGDYNILQIIGDIK